MVNKQNSNKKLFSLYWQCYGGWKALFKSYYLYLALFFSLGLMSLWCTKSWWEDAMSIVPNTLGFALGGYAILLAFGDEKFRSLISGSEKGTEYETVKTKVSPFLLVNASFVHFILMLILSLLTALISKAFPELMILRFIGFTVFIYSLLLAIATTLSVFRMAYWYDTYIEHQKDKKPEDQ